MSLNLASELGSKIRPQRSEFTVAGPELLDDQLTVKEGFRGLPGY